MSIDSLFGHSKLKNFIINKTNPLFLYFIVFIFVIFGIYFFPNLHSQPQTYFGKKISKIEFYGLKNLKTDELYEVMVSRINKNLSEIDSNEDMRKLFALGYFSNIIIRVNLLADNTVKLIFEVSELPQIEEINYIGLNKLSTQDFLKKVDLTDKSFLSIQKVKSTAKIIKESAIEQGYSFAEVWYKVSKVNELNRVKVNFIIDEGEFLPISKINIIGTRRIEPDKILSALQQKESGSLSQTGFQKSKFEEDKITILTYAKSQGLLDAQLDPELTGYEIRWKDASKPEKGRVVVVTYKLLEGDLKFFGGYSIEYNYKKY